MKLKRRFPVLACLVCALACSIPAFAEDENAKAAESPAAETVEAGDFTFRFGSPWKKAPNSSNMVSATLAHGDGKDATQVDFYFFGAGQGGGVQANVDRWIGQFEGEPKVETRTAKHGGTKVTYVFATGTYLSGRPIGPKTPMKEYALHGAILEGKTAPVFLKMTGPAKAMEGAKKDFEKLAASPFAK